MPSNDTTTKFRADISQLKSQMQAASRAVKVATSEFKAATAGLDDWSKSATGLQAKLKQLDTTLSSQNKQLALMEDELEKTVKVYGENSAAADNVRIKINNQKAAIAQTQKQIQRYNQDLSDCQNGVGKFATEQDKAVTASDKLKKAISDQESELNDLKKAYQDAKLDDNADAAEQYAKAIKELSNELKDNKARLSDAENAADEFDDSLEKMDDASTNASDGFTVMKGALANLVADGIRLAVDAIKDLAKETFSVGSSFESAMSQVEAVSGATAEEMEALTAKAEEMGAKTKFSASESAEAFNYMAMAGWKTEDMLNGIEGIMNLAAASGSDLATASDIVTDALTAMGYGAEDAGRLADVMAAASSNANTNVEMMGATFQYAAPIVGALGYSMEDTAVAIGLMANAGIKGEKSGTALRSILTRLSAPPKECAEAMEELGITLTDEAGNMKELDDVMGDLRKAFSGLSETQKTQYAKSIAGQEAMSGLLAITSATTTDFDKLTEAVQNSNGAAQDMADTMQDNVSGQLTLLKSKIEGIMIKIFNKASDSMTKGIHKVGDALDSVNWDKVGDGVGAFAKTVADFFSYVIKNAPVIINVLKTVGATMATIFVVNKVGTFIGWLNSLSKAYTELNSIMAVLKTTQLGLNAAQLASPIGLAVVAIAGLTAGYVALTKAQDKAIEKEYGLTEAEKDLNSEIYNTYQAQKDLISARNESIESTTGEFNYIKQLKDEYNNLVDSNGQVKEGYEDRANFILNELASALGMEVSEIQKVIDKNGELGQSIDDLIQKKQAEATLAAYDESYSEAKRNEAQLLQNVIDKQNDYNDSKQAYADKQAEYNQVEKDMQDAMKYGAEFANGYSAKLSLLSKELETAKEANNENKKALQEANTAYTDAQSTIQSYEGLSSAIISGDVTKINEELTKLTQGFKDAKSSTQTELEEQVKNYEQYYKDIKAAMDAGNPVITQEMVDNAKEMVDKAQDELDKFTPAASESGEKAGSAYASAINSKQSAVEQAGANLKNSATKGTENPETDKTGKAAGQSYEKGLKSVEKDIKAQGKKMAQQAKAGADTKDDTTDSEASGSNFGEGFFLGMGKWLTKVFDRGKNLSQQAKKGVAAGDNEGSPAKDLIKSGGWFAEGFDIGIRRGTKAVVKSAFNMADDAVNAVRKAQKEGSPSKLTYQSGKYFVQGYINGIVSQEQSLVRTVKSLVKSLVKELTNVSDYNFSEVGQNASTLFANTFGDNLNYILKKLKYQNEQKLKEFDSDIEYYQALLEGRIDVLNDEIEKRTAALEARRDENIKNLEAARDANIKKLESDRDKAIKQIEGDRDAQVKALQKQIDKLGSSDADKKKKKELQAQIKQIKENASARIKALKESAANAIAAQKENTSNAIEAEKTNTAAAIANLEANIKAEIEANKAAYNDLIANLQKNKEAYQQASAAMIEEYTAAMNEYQTQAQALIDDTINGVVDTYDQKYNDLLNKQDNLISKLQGMNELFTVSSAGVGVVVDIKETTKQVKEYTSKLKEIKDKVSAELFDEITQMDVDTGSAYMDRLLAMSENELKDYNDAYSEFLEATQEAAENIYESDFDKIAQDYENDINQAFADLPAQLEELGKQAMQGFIEGFVKNTDFMSDEIKTFVNAMVDTFKSELGIHSPSRVTMALGAFTGEGFADGLQDMLNTIKKTAQNIADVVTDELDFSDSINVAKVATTSVSGLNRNAGSFSGGNTTQNINFYQTNTSPKALDRLTIYRQTNNMLFSAKVRLSDV